ncbi:type II 3-dehydroquinate dehydratase [Halioxenophilus aromaticivorans]|uniref:3-dehydroquinate dehydratase n=1 Tax=Halioxenophilus aromaticivorans TaxID=1306992 RepID=A0AAV3U1Q8_9ALTE
MTIRIAVINGPNLNLLGVRQPEIYGYDTLADLESQMRAAAGNNAQLSFMQSNHEGEIIEEIHRARNEADAIIINPAAYSHTSVAILDALNTFEGKVMEVHLSNIHKREKFRHHSWVSGRADAVICGMGMAGYLAALNYLMAS